MAEIIYKEDEFVEDLLDSLNKITDIKCNGTIQKKILKYGIGTLLSVEKKMGSSIEILDVEEINEDNILSI